jgi:hypothetical protein
MQTNDVVELLGLSDLARNFHHLKPLTQSALIRGFYDFRPQGFEPILQRQSETDSPEFMAHDCIRNRGI